MSPVSQSHSVADAVEPDDPGADIWLKYHELSGQELDSYSKSAKDMNGVLTFVGLFSAVVAACLIEAYKTLQPDKDDQAILLLTQVVTMMNGSVPLGAEAEPPPFRASNIAVAINTLWFAGLAVSLMAALVATLYQEWTRQLLKIRVRRQDMTLEEYSLEHLRHYMGAQKYGFDSVAPLVVGLMHSALFLFVAGLDIFLFTVHFIPALATTILTGLGALFYVRVSLAPLWDAECVYHTPLTSLLSWLIMLPLSTTLCVFGYIGVFVWAVISRMTRGPLHPIWRYLLSYQFWWKPLRNPLHTTRFFRALVTYALRGESEETDDTLTLRDYLKATVIEGSAPQTKPPMSGSLFRFFYNYVGGTILDSPLFLQHIVNELLDPRSAGSDIVFVGIRNKEVQVEKITAGLASVESADDAVGTLRLLQKLLMSQDFHDDMLQVVSAEQARWSMMDSLIEVSAAYAERLSAVNAKAMKEKDLRVCAAVCSFRRSLLLLWKRVPQDLRSQAVATQRVQSLILAFEAPDNTLRLLPLSLDQETGSRPLFPPNEDPCREIGACNALTLASAALRCGWQGRDWSSPETLYSGSKMSPNMWCWNVVFPAVGSQQHKPAASEIFRDLLSQADPRLHKWAASGSTLAIPPDVCIPPIAIRVLTDLARQVDLRSPIPPSVDGETDVQTASAPEDSTVLPEDCHAADDLATSGESSGVQTSSTTQNSSTVAVHHVVPEESDTRTMKLAGLGSFSGCSSSRHAIIESLVRRSTALTSHVSEQ